MTAPWFALYTTHERRAADDLLAIRLTVFWPTRKRWMKTGRTKGLVNVGLLPPYVFARIPDDAFRAVLASRHILWALGSSKPCRIPEHIMTRAIHDYTMGGWDDEMPPPPPPAPNPKGKAWKPTITFGDFAELAAFLSQQSQPIASAA